MKQELQPTAELEIIGALALFLLKKTGSIFGQFQGRITAADQRECFGCVPFGKLSVTISGEKETVCTFRKVAFGTDFEVSEFTWAEFEKLCRANRHPFELGRYSAKYSTLPR